MSNHQTLAALATPLLHPQEENAEKQDSLCCQNRSWRLSLSQVVEEMKELYTIAMPMIMTGILLYGKSAISMLFMGELGKEALAGGSLAIGVANITGYSIISGLAMGTEVISSQACGAQQWPLMGQTLHRAIIILTIMCIPISLFWLNCKPFLIILHQDPIISSIACTYLTFSLPDLLFQSFIYPLRIYLRTQNITLPLVFGSAFALALHAPVNYVVAHHLNLGIQGIALASAFTDFNLLASILIYLCFSPTCRKSLQHRFSLGCYQEWRSVLLLAFPTCVSVCLEWWWYELMIFLSGLLTNARDSVATMGILIQATSLIYIFPTALSQAVSTRVGNELGANRSKRAKTSSFISLSLAVVTGIIAMLFMIAMRNTWGKLFAKDKSIVSLTAMCMPVVGLCELGNSPQTICCGVLRGSARPSLGAQINLGSFYGVGLPMAISMAFGLNMGLLGLWVGLFLAHFVCSVLMVTVLVKTDWTIQAYRARELTGVVSAEESKNDGSVVPVVVTN